MVVQLNFPAIRVRPGVYMQVNEIKIERKISCAKRIYSCKPVKPGKCITFANMAQHTET